MLIRRVKRSGSQGGRAGGRGRGWKGQGSERDHTAGRGRRRRRHRAEEVAAAGGATQERVTAARRSGANRGGGPGPARRHKAAGL